MGILIDYIKGTIMDLKDNRSTPEGKQFFFNPRVIFNVPNLLNEYVYGGMYRNSAACRQ